MKLLVLMLVCIFFLSEIKAQNTSWFYGTWKGVTYFPNGPVTKRIIIKLQVTKVSGNAFEATLDNLFPSDSIIRMTRHVTGSIAGKNFLVKTNEQTYIRDPRTQNFWYDCTGCAVQSTFSITSEKVVIKLATTNCGDVCDGETTFSRDTSELDSSQKIQLAKWFGLPVKNNTVKAKKNKKDTAAVAAAKPATAPPKKDSIQVKPVVKKEKPAPVKKDSIVAVNTAKKEVKKDTIPPAPAKDTSAFTTRTTNLINTYQVTSPHITVQLYDNAEIDGDMVSVYHNGKLLAGHQTLTHKAITFTITASKQDPHHEFVMVADNLGLIPPNTALLRITAGTQKFELEISSDFDNNAKIAIDYTGE